MLRADQLEQAQKTVALFTKDGDQHSNLFDMQARNNSKIKKE